MMLDTSVCIDLLRETARGVEGPARQALAALGNVGVSISVYTECELRTGLELSERPDEERLRLTHLLERLNILHPEPGFPVLYAECAAALLKRGTPIPVMDLLIGVTAKSHGLAVLTRDTKHFSRIPGLVVLGYE